MNTLHMYTNPHCAKVFHFCASLCKEITSQFTSGSVLLVLLMSIRVHLSPGSPYVNCLYKYHVLSLWHTFLMGHTANFLLVRFHVQ